MACFIQNDLRILGADDLNYGGEFALTNVNVLISLTDKCDIYFENYLISKERIIKTYADFFASTLSDEEHSVSIALHTGSICFDIVSFVIAALGCLVLDMTTPEQVIDSLNIGDMVMYKSERYRWCGNKYFDGKKYLVLEQDGHGKNGKSTISIPYNANKNLIKPYLGSSELTDGRGIRRTKTNRAKFISYIFDIPLSEVQGIVGVSTVIVTERSMFDRISKGLEFIYDGGERIGLLDIVTASYYADSGEEYQYGNNPAKAEPVLKITGKISTARDLVLERSGNKTVGLIIISLSAVSKGSSELMDLLGRKSLRFAHVAAIRDSDDMAGLVETQEGAKVFACTKEFLLQNSLPPKVPNFLTLELNRQIENIVNNVVTTVIVDGSCSWEDLRKAKESLYTIRKSEWNDDLKNNFIIAAYSLLNLFLTAVFSIQVLESTIKEGRLNTGISSPALRINELWNLAGSAGMLEYQCAYVVDVLERLYKIGFERCPKYDVLKQYIETSNGRKIAVVVPKAYYIDILASDEILIGDDVTVATANQFDNSVCYDEIIVVGDLCGKRFNPLRCRAAADITVLLYEFEMHSFKYKMRQVSDGERKLNSRIGIIDVEKLEEIPNIARNFNYGDIEAFNNEESELERYIDSISTFDIGNFVACVSGSVGNSPKSEITAVGQFISGEQILCSKYYKALVFDSIKGTVIETDTENLNAGDILVFAKRDDYTRNMVDYIYENLQATGRLKTDVLNATEKACYWKAVLREYKDVHNFSYKDIAKGLKKIGSSLQEVSIRQWLIEESHIVGPRDEKTLEQIAKLTQDSYLLGDTHGYYEACRIVRKQRKEILELIGKAITGKLSGHTPPKGSVLEIVYGNVENLSGMLELERFSLLDETVIVPINIINKPITEAEVSI